METKTFTKNARKQLKLNQTEFAKLVSRRQSVISRWESGKIETPGNMVLRIQNILFKDNCNTKVSKSKEKK